jgi:hypothetical protein
MPLVVPGLMSGSSNKTDDWQNKLMGKKIGDSSDTIVSLHWRQKPSAKQLQTFAKKDLPSEHRVVKEGDMMTMDHKPDRFVYTAQAELELTLLD